MNVNAKQDALFDDGGARDDVNKPPPGAPLAERCRPASLDEVFGQNQILGADRPLRKAIESDRVPSIVFWGPPGTGKTTLARLIARLTDARFLQLSAVSSGTKDLRAVVEAARRHQGAGEKTILFIDEIHRWNKSQQDALLPHVESGLITLIGATTENPSFEINAALLSRVTVYTLSSLNRDDLIAVLKNGLETLKREEVDVSADDKALEAIAGIAHGDARSALNALEQAVLYFGGEGAVHLEAETLAQALQKKRLLYDKKGEEHFNVISAFHKSMRGSDPQAALYWLARMLEAGEDPLYAARRMIRFASEDVGLADPNALLIAIAARDSYQTLGSPEGELALAQAAVYLAAAPKSNALYTALDAAMSAVDAHGYLPVPLHIRNAPTRLMKNMGYGKDYQYAHNFDHAYVAQDYLPDALKDKTFYSPTDRGYEQKIAERMKFWRELARENDKRRPRDDE